jgi:transcriptional regulator with XRE-family HTH domain
MYCMEFYDLRSKASLTQAALADLVGTTPSVISRLEDAGYEGHSLAMLRRIAVALNRRLEIRFLAPRKKARTRAGAKGHREERGQDSLAGDAADLV